jgi:3-deoxy-D-manno-octulosonate 8-phosphate phosphatase (KDO 8-P phosphatase)
MELSEEIATIASQIKLLAMDCDGVLTDGKLYYGPEGEQIKVFHVHDGQGIVSLHLAGIASAIITARSSVMLSKRANELSVGHLIQNAKDKAAAIRTLCEQLNILPKEVAFVGDDVADVPALKIVGLPIAVANGVPAVKAEAALVTSKNGGSGAVREVAEMLIRSSSK